MGVKDVDRGIFRAPPPFSSPVEGEDEDPDRACHQRWSD